MWTWIRKRWRKNAWAPEQLSSWRINDARLGLPPRAVKSENPPYIPRDWHRAGWHELLFWASVFNLPLAPILAVLAGFEGDALLAVIMGALGLTPSMVGWGLARKLAPPASKMLQAARTWHHGEATVLRVEESHATAQISRDDKTREAVLTISDSREKKKKKILLQAQDPPLYVGEKVSVLVDPTEPGQFEVVRQMKGVLLVGALPQSGD